MQLDEDGTLHSRTIKIDVYEWPDYVFYTNYNLLPLKQVKNFISQNGHLPEVPSAKEMTDNGLNIAEINQLLLKKIEELTLYIIEQDERLRIIEEKLKN